MKTVLFGILMLMSEAFFCSAKAPAQTATNTNQAGAEQAARGESCNLVDSGMSTQCQHLSTICASNNNEKQKELCQRWTNAAKARKSALDENRIGRGKDVTEAESADQNIKKGIQAFIAYALQGTTTIRHSGLLFTDAYKYIKNKFAKANCRYERDKDSAVYKGGYSCNNLTD